MKFTQFSTDPFPIHDRYEAWRNRNWPSLASVMDTRGPSEPFYARTSTCHLGEIPLTYTQIAGQAYERPAEKIRQDNIDHMGVLVMLSGRYSGETSNGSFSGGAGTVLIGDMSLPYAQASTASDSITLSVPRRLFWEGRMERRRLHGIVLEGPPATMIAEYISLLGTHLPKMPDASAPHVMRAVLAMIGAGLEAAGVFEPAPEAIEANALQRSKWFIEQNLHDPQLDAAAVVAATGLSRSSLYRLFQVHDGLARYIRSRRLDRAHAFLTNPFDRRNISEIAYAVGFRDLPQFSRAYRNRFGATPSMTRRGECR